MSAARSKLPKSVAAAAIVIVVIAGAYVAYLWGTYIDEVTDTGEAYGLVIGETKRQTFEKLPTAFGRVGFKGQEVFTEIQADAVLAKSLDVTQGRRVMVRPNLSAEGFLDLSAEDRWTFYNEQNYQDFLRLSFCGEELCRIYRHRKHFELP
ncbi:MAG: hypothetical protein ACREPV_08485 [Lysobacter sp.]